MRRTNDGELRSNGKVSTRHVRLQSPQTLSVVHLSLLVPTLTADSFVNIDVIRNLTALWGENGCIAEILGVKLH